MTFRTAKSLLSPGDIVFIPGGGRIHRATIQQINRDHLVTDLDTVFFDEVADIWFLTIKGAVTALKGGTKNA